MLGAKHIGYAPDSLARTLEILELPLAVKGGGVEYDVIVDVRTVLSRGY